MAWSAPSVSAASGAEDNSLPSRAISLIDVRALVSRDTDRSIS